MSSSSNPQPPEWANTLAGNRFTTLSGNSGLFWVEREVRPDPLFESLLNRAIEEDVLVSPVIDIDGRAGFHLPEGVVPVEFLADELLVELEGDIDLVTSAIARIAEVSDLGFIRELIMPFMLHRNFSRSEVSNAIVLAPSFVDAVLDLRKTGQGVGSVAINSTLFEG